MTREPDMLDAQTLFSRMRQWVPSGIGAMPMHTILHQMGGRPGVDPFGWSDGRIRAAVLYLVDEGTIEMDAAGRYCVTDAGIRKYERTAA